MPGLAYVTADGAFLCPDCANRKNGSIAFANDDNTSPRGTYDDQWRIIGSQFVWNEAKENGNDVLCAHCNAVIVKAPVVLDATPLTK
jgi:hypothetical protein